MSINLAEIRQQNLIARGILTPEQLQERKRAGEMVARTNAKHSATSQGMIQMKRNHEDARENLRKKWIQQRSVPTPVTNPAQLSTQRHIENDRFILEASKEIPGVLTWSSQIGRDILRYTNEYRATRGLPALQWNQEIHDVSLAHSQQMANGQKGFDHSGFSNRINSLSFKPKALAENLYMSNVENNYAKEAVNGWIRSPGHHKNLIGNFRLCAIGVHKNMSTGQIYATQIFTL